MPNEETEISVVETSTAEPVVAKTVETESSATKSPIIKSPPSKVEKKLYNVIKNMSEEEAREFISLVQKQSGAIDEAIAAALAEMAGESGTEEIAEPGAEIEGEITGEEIINELPERGTGLETGRADEERQMGEPRTDEERLERHAATEVMVEEELENFEDVPFVDLPQGLTEEQIEQFERMEKYGTKPNPQGQEYNAWLLWMSWKKQGGKMRAREQQQKRTQQPIQAGQTVQAGSETSTPRAPEEKIRAGAGIQNNTGTSRGKPQNQSMEDTMSDNETIKKEGIDAKTVEVIANDALQDANAAEKQKSVLPIESFTQDDFNDTIQEFSDKGIKRISTLTHDDVVRFMLMAENDPKEFAKELSKVYPSKILSGEVEKLDSFSDVTNADMLDSFSDALNPYRNTDSFAEAQNLLEKEVCANGSAWQFYCESSPTGRDLKGKERVEGFLKDYITPTEE